MKEKMTREEAIDWLYRLISNLVVYMPKEWHEKIISALSVAIQALEQQSCEDIPTITIPVEDYIKLTEQELFINKPCVSEKVCEHDKQMVLDKIRAEIKEKIEQEEFARSVFRHEEKDVVKAEQGTGSIMAYNNVIKLIDKYKAEIEQQESEGKE